MLAGSVERWLTHEGCRFKRADSDEDSFRVIARRASIAIRFEVFEPAAQPGILVLGMRCALSNSQNARYRSMSEYEKEGLEVKISAYCNTIKAVHRFDTMNGKRMIGVYVVLDNKDQINQTGFSAAMADLSGMHEKMQRFLLKIF